jgi:hypothetical protein
MLLDIVSVCKIAVMVTDSKIGHETYDNRLYSWHIAEKVLPLVRCKDGPNPNSTPFDRENLWEIEISTQSYYVLLSTHKPVLLQHQ